MDEEPHKINELSADENAKKLLNSVRDGDLKSVKELLKYVKKIDSITNCYDETLLMTACSKKYLEISKELISAGVDVNKMNDRGKTALIYACDSYSTDSEVVNELVKILLENGANPNKYKKGYDGAIHYAAMYNQVEAVKLLAQNGVNIDAKGSYGRTPLIYAASSAKSLEMVRFFISSGANVNAKNDADKNAVFELITNEDSNAEIAEFLIQSGCDIHSNNKSHGTVLHWAAFCGRLNIVELLLKYKVDINAKNQFGHTPMRQAMSQHKTDVVKFLFRNGGTAVSKDSMSWNELEYAIEKNDVEFAKEIIERFKTEKKNLPSGALFKAAKQGDLKTIEILIAAGVPVDDVRYKGDETPLIKASYYGKIEVVKYLLSKGANIKARDYRGNTALLNAAWAGNTNVVVLLLENGAEINERNNLNWNALMQACIEGHFETAKLLLEKGSPTDEVDKEKGATALTLAKASKVQKLVDLLISYGAKERKIKLRKENEPFFSVFKCDICKYLPHKKDLARTEIAEDFNGLDTIYEEITNPDRYATDSMMVKRCSNCGTYYLHYHSVDYEDAFISGPSISQNFQRLNFLRLKILLAKIGKNDELKEIEEKYDSLIEELFSKLNSISKTPIAFLPFIIENLTDFYISNKDWEGLNSNLLENKNPLVVMITAFDLLTIMREKPADIIFPYYRENRDTVPEIVNLYNSFSEKHFEYVIKVAEKYKNSKFTQVKLLYQRFRSVIDYYKLEKKK